MGFFDKIFSGLRKTRNTVQLDGLFAGFTKADDWLPDRMFEPFKAEGPSKGKCVDPVALRKIIDIYYDMQGWDVETGFVRDGVLYNLDIKWARP